jgi:cardiolipin synthase (CMP-forming)
MFYERLLVRLRKERFRPTAIAAYALGTLRRSKQSLGENPEFVRSLLVVTLILFGILFVLSTWLSISISRSIGIRFLVWSSAWLGLVFFWPLVHTSLSRDSEGTPLAKVTVANFFSLLRLSLVPGIFILILSKNTGYAITLFAAGALSDVLDGFIARILSQQTRMGVVMDPIVDVAFNMSVIWALVISWKLSPVIGLLITLRYVLLLGGAAFIYVFRGPVRIRPTVFGRLTAVFLSVMILAFMYLGQYGSRLLRDSLSGLMETGLAILLIGTILHVIFMGIYSLRLYPKIVAAEEERTETREDAGV